jgi:hypothetical protein
MRFPVREPRRRLRQGAGVKRRVLAVQTQPFVESTWLARSSAEQ